MVNFPKRIAVNEMALRRYIIALLFWRPERETLPRLAQRLVAARVVTHQFDAPPLEPKVRAYMMEGAACATLIRANTISSALRGVERQRNLAVLKQLVATQPAPLSVHQ